MTSFKIAHSHDGDWSKIAKSLAEDLGATILGCHHDHATPEIVAAAHAAGLYVWTYTVNDAARAATLKQRGVDGIISDRVGELRAELAAGAQ